MVAVDLEEVLGHLDRRQEAAGEGRAVGRNWTATYMFALSPLMFWTVTMHGEGSGLVGLGCCSSPVVLLVVLQ